MKHIRKFFESQDLSEFKTLEDIFLSFGDEHPNVEIEILPVEKKFKEDLYPFDSIPLGNLSPLFVEIGFFGLKEDLLKIEFLKNILTIWLGRKRDIDSCLYPKEAKKIIDVERKKEFLSRISHLTGYCLDFYSIGSAFNDDDPNGVNGVRHEHQILLIFKLKS